MISEAEAKRIFAAGGSVTFPPTESDPEGVTATNLSEVPEGVEWGAQISLDSPDHPSKKRSAAPAPAQEEDLLDKNSGQKAEGETGETEGERGEPEVESVVKTVRRGK